MTSTMCSTGKKIPGQDCARDILLSVEPADLPRFYFILQSGFFVKTPGETSIRAFLCEELGLSSRYVDDKISTVFLDGKPVDHIDSALIREGVTLALSSSMPGLVGATMRRGGYYSPLRNSITHMENHTLRPGRELVFRVKLFNTLIASLGPRFLERGVCLPVHEMIEVLSERFADLLEGSKSPAIASPQSKGIPPPAQSFDDRELLCLMVKTRSPGHCERS